MQFQTFHGNSDRSQRGEFAQIYFVQRGEKRFSLASIAEGQYAGNDECWYKGVPENPDAVPNVPWE